MIQALEQMSVRDVIPADESFPATSQNILPPARNLIGSTAVLPQVIQFAPIVLSASGVTIVVGVGVVVLASVVVGKLSKECQEQWDEAIRQCVEWLSSPNPPRNMTGGHKNPKDCARGHVDERCGGNKLDWEGQGARPGRRT